MKAIPTFLACLFAGFLFSQSNIQQTLSVNGTGTTADPSAQLDVSATDKGVLVPRMTTPQRTAITAANALLVFDTDTKSFWFFDSVAAAWREIRAGNIATLADADGDTKIQLEESPDEDVIRFDLAGTEYMRLLENASGQPRLELLAFDRNTFVGLEAGAANTTGDFNTAYGANTLFSNTTGSSNTANGVSALSSNTTGSSNTASGRDALSSNTTGNNNTANGRFALSSNTTGFNNTANGVSALLLNTTGDNNTANGAFALRFNTTGDNNTATGDDALRFNNTGFSNVAMGKDALFNNTDRSNLVAVGDSALYNNGVGATQSFDALHNTAIGSKALFSNTTGSSNTANGSQALLENTTGTQNTATGFSTLPNNTTGFSNTANGCQALVFNTTGSLNTAIGRTALTNNTTGNNNTALGALADVSVGGLNSATVIGVGAFVNASNKVRIGNTFVTVIEGQVAYTFPSDARFKFNVQDEGVPGLAFIEKLRPVAYQFDTRKFDEHLMQNMPDSVQQRRMAGQDYSKSTAIVQTGFLAQEVEQVCKDLNFTFSGLHVPESDVDNYGLAYGSFVPLLVKSIQEQQSEIEALKAENERLKKVEAQLDKITAALSGAGIAVEK